MINKILYQHHIMWYESMMINETLDSLEIAIQNSHFPVDLEFCINLQTYIESPISGSTFDMIAHFIHHPILKNANITYKTNQEAFFNIGDWRRDIYNSEYKYTVWGESDCLVPSDYFYILSMLDITDPHIVTLASRRMGDNTWDIVEHEALVSYPRNPLNGYDAPNSLSSIDTISYDEMEKFNEQFDINVLRLNTLKVDGALVALSSRLPTPFIPIDMHFAREDTCAERFFDLNGIHQYIIKTRIKGHNYRHPLKRTNTHNTRDDNVYKQYARESEIAMVNFLKNEFVKRNDT